MFISIIIKGTFFSIFFSSFCENLPFIPFPFRAGEGDERITRAWDAWLVWPIHSWIHPLPQSVLCSSIIIQLFWCLWLVRSFFSASAGSIQLSQLDPGWVKCTGTCTCMYLAVLHTSMRIQIQGGEQWCRPDRSVSSPRLDSVPWL